METMATETPGTTVMLEIPGTPMLEIMGTPMLEIMGTPMLEIMGTPMLEIMGTPMLEIMGMQGTPVPVTLEITETMEAPVAVMRPAQLQCLVQQVNPAASFSFLKLPLQAASP